MRYTRTGLLTGIQAISDQVFAVPGNRPRYAYDGAERLQAFLREYPEHADCTVPPAALRVDSSNAVKASAAQFALVNESKTLMPAATVTLRSGQKTNGLFHRYRTPKLKSIALPSFKRTR